MRYFTFLSIALSLVLLSCEGPQGIPGPPGLPGQDGGLIVSSSFEIVVDFNAANGYEFIEPYGFEVLPTDVTLVYILWEEDINFDIWRLCPQKRIF